MARRGLACDEGVRRSERGHKQQGGLSPADYRFFKIMFGEDYSKVMYLPPWFAKKVKHLTNKETIIEDVQGDRWSVTLSCVKGSLAFKEGWLKFSQYHHLKEGDFLIFSYLKGSHFTAEVFGRSGRPRISFDNEKLRPSKKSRRDPATTSEDEPHQAADVYSGVKPVSATSVASGDESQWLENDFAVGNAEFGITEHLPTPVNYEDSMCMINWENRRHEEENSNRLYDLSSFEMENRTCVKTLKPLIVMLDPPQTETARHDANLENAAGTKVSRSYIGAIEPTKPAGDDAMKLIKTPVTDAEKSGIQTDLVTGNIAGTSTDKFEKAVDTKRGLSYTEITEQIRKLVDASRMSPRSSPTGGPSRDALTNTVYKIPSDNSNLKKSLLDKVYNSQDGSSKVAEREHTLKRKFSFVSSSDPPGRSDFISKFSSSDPPGRSYFISKVSTSDPPGRSDFISKVSSSDPPVRPAIKKELVEMEDKSNIFARISIGGKEPPMVWNHAQVISPIVKVEPDLPHETNPLDAIGSTFSAVVKSRFYLELPENIAPSRKRKSRIEGMVLILRDSTRRLWPVVYREYYNGRALTVNWTQFCVQHNIMPGDECRFLVEDATQRIYRVDVAHGSV